MTGLSGTRNFPFSMVIFAPSAGDLDVGGHWEYRLEWGGIRDCHTGPEDGQTEPTFLGTGGELRTTARNDGQTDAPDFAGPIAETFDAA